MFHCSSVRVWHNGWLKLTGPASWFTELQSVCGRPPQLRLVVRRSLRRSATDRGGRSELPWPRQGFAAIPDQPRSAIGVRAKPTLGHGVPGATFVVRPTPVAAFLQSKARSAPALGAAGWMGSRQVRQQVNRRVSQPSATQAARHRGLTVSSSLRVRTDPTSPKRSDGIRAVSRSAIRRELTA